jgi:hypothetical protein
LGVPSAQASTILQRWASAWDDFARRDQRTSVSRSAAVSRNSAFGRPVLAMAASLTYPSNFRRRTLVLLTPVPLPTPLVVDQLGEDMAWCVDVAVPGHQPPARTAITNAALLERPTGFPEAVVRVSRHGLSFTSRNRGLVPGGAAFEGRLAHPLLRLPSTEQILAELAAKHGATVHRSAAGRMAANAAELWGSFTAFTADLTGDVRRLLDAFIPPPATKGYYGHGYEIRGDGYLTVGHAAQVLGLDALETPDVLDRLLAIKVLRRGLLLSCERCSAQAFYPIGAVGEDGFACSACGYPSRLRRGRWYKGDPEPAWNYALDQVVRDLLRQHGDIPLLAAAHLAKDKHSFLWAPEQELLVAGEGTAELDLCLIADGKIVVGEAKLNDRLDTADKGTTLAARRLIRAAHILSADEVVLATAQAAWTPGARIAVENAITELHMHPRPKLIELTRIGTPSR